MNQAIRELEQNQWRATTEVRDLQQRKLTQLLSFAQQNVPHYRVVLRGLGIGSNRSVFAAGLEQIPMLTKSIIRDEKDSLVSEDLTRNRLLPISTSGSTGEATQLFTDLRSTAFRKATEIRSDSWTGWRLGDRCVSLWGAPMDQKRVMNLRGRVHGVLTSRRFLSSFDMTTSKLDEYIETIRRFKPVMFLAYPGPMEQFAIHCKRRGAVFPSLRAIVSSAETLWAYQREVIEDAFGVKVFDRYGCREVGQIGSECEMHDGLHVSADRLLVEVVDDEGRPKLPGETGRILVTDLDNFGMPLIRYDIGDRGAWAESRPCKCGRGLPLLKKVEGRTMDIIRTPDGHQLGGTFWTLMLKTRPGLRQIQVVQEKPNGVVVNFVRDADFDHAVLDYFTDRIQEYCGRNFGVEFAEKESIDLTVSGKQRLIVSKIGSRRADR